MKDTIGQAECRFGIESYEMNNYSGDRKLTKEKENPHFKQTNDPSVNRILYRPRPRGAKVELRLRRMAWLKSVCCLLYRRLYLPEISEGVMGFLGELGGKRVPPYAPKAQCSA